ncbi:MAG TPA: SBBP repeat-containing protein, partial [Candidatus Acidoferrum sp.]|nr:SBBP repeat-containing protein [Candidatus Acidoferrum sp.]
MKIQGNSGIAASRQLRRTKATCIAGFVVALTLCVVAVPLFSAPTTAVADGKYGKARLAFEPNVGQSDGQVKFLARADGYTLFLTSAETVFLLKADTSTSSADSRTVPGSALRLSFQNAKPTRPMDASEKLVGKVNYFRGNDAKGWLTGIPTFARVTQRGVYSGIDVVYYGNQKQLEYDFIVAPGANPRAIALALSGAQSVKVDASGDLVIVTPAGEVRMQRPLAYQQDANGNRQMVAADYVLRGANRVGLHVGKYDVRRELIIDPILEYSTYLGGSNIDGANAIAVAQDKTAFVAGGTFSTDFPTAHPLQPNHGGPDDFSRDAFVAKLSSDGSTVLYATYLGGENEDEATGIAVDTFGDAYVTGTTQSPHFPVSDTIPTVNPECGGDGQCGASLNPGHLIVSNGFVVKLNPAGSALLYSSFIGYFEIVRARSIAVDANQIAYITGEVTDNFTPIVTGSTPPPPPFPITGNAAQPLFGGGQFDGFLIVISASGNSVVYCTYLGGADEDGAKGVAVDNNRNAYVTGLTYSVNYPTTGSAYQLGNGSNGDAFFTKINTTGGPFVYSTLLGGNGLDQGNGIAVDSSGNAYVAGQSSSSTLTSLRPYGGNGDAFVAKFNPSLSGAASLLYFTYLGGSLADTAAGVAVDSNGNAYVTGSTVSSNFPVVGAVFQPEYGGGNADAFVTKIDPSGANTVYSTFLGGSNTESGNGIAVDSDGSAYVAGQTCSLDFPLTNPEQASSGGNCDAFVSKVSILNGIILNPNGLVFQSLNVGASSQPQTVTLTTGDSSVAISSITLSGANPGDFAQTTNCGATVPSGTQCTFNVTFAPTAVGLRKANLNIADTENGNPTTHVVALTGSTSTVQLSASSLTFTAQSIGTTSAPQTITVTNVGTASLTISGVVASSDFAASDNCTHAP